MSGRLSSQNVEVLVTNDPLGRLAVENVEVLVANTPKLRTSQVVLEILVPNPVQTQLISHSLSFTQTVYRVAPESVSSTLTITHNITQTIKTYSLSDNIAFTQNIDDVEVYLRTISQSITIVSTVARNFTHNLTFTQTIVVEKRKKVSSVVNFTQLISKYVVHNRSLTDSLTISQRIQPNYSVKHTLSITQVTPTVYKKVFIKTITSSLSLTSSIVNYKIDNRTINSTIYFLNTLVNKQKYNISLSNSLIFGNNRFISSLLPNQVITIPGIDAVKTRCLIRLQWKNGVIILPCPIFGDTENLQHKLTVKRSMNGLKRTYIKKNLRSKLNYTFRLDRQKSLELISFYKSLMNACEHNNYTIITMENFKGEKWLGYITNDPIFTKKTVFANCGEETDVALEFEGIKLN